jgi:hypothetical protein
MSLRRKSERTTPRENALALLCMLKAMFQNVKDIQNATSLEQASAVMVRMDEEVILKKPDETDEEKLEREAKINLQFRIRTVVLQYKLK